MKKIEDGLSRSGIEIRPYKLLSTVCVSGGVNCPICDNDEIKKILNLLKNDPTLRIRLISDVDEIVFYREIEPKDYSAMDKQEILNRKRDLDVLQKLGLVPGDTRRARYLYERLFQKIKTLKGLCSYNTTGWEGCSYADSGVYESISNKGFSAIVYLRDESERKAYRLASVSEIENTDKIYIRPHHLMCMCCRYDGGNGYKYYDNDNIYEIMKRVREKPDISIVLVEGVCMVCDPCDGYDPKTGRCVHGGGLIRDYKKDLDVFQKLGLMPGATMSAKELFPLMFEKIPSTRDICGYDDGIVTSYEWGICGSPEGSESYIRTIEKGIF
jgi:hypothetical protein